MKLTWALGQGPATTQELADEVVAEGRLGVNRYITPEGLRCLWGVINSFSWNKDSLCERANRQLRAEEAFYLQLDAGCSSTANDDFSGTLEERCTEMVRRLRAIP